MRVHVLFILIQLTENASIQQLYECSGQLAVNDIVHTGMMNQTGIDNFEMIKSLTMTTVEYTKDMKDNAYPCGMKNSAYRY